MVGGLQKHSSYSRRSLPFPLFHAFLSPSLPPLFAPATQATDCINKGPLVPFKMGSGGVSGRVHFALENVTF